MPHRSTQTRAQRHHCSEGVPRGCVADLRQPPRIRTNPEDETAELAFCLINDALKVYPHAAPGDSHVEIRSALLRSQLMASSVACSADLGARSYCGEATIISRICHGLDGRAIPPSACRSTSLFGMERRTQPGVLDGTRSAIRRRIVRKPGFRNRALMNPIVDHLSIRESPHAIPSLQAIDITPTQQQFDIAFRPFHIFIQLLSRCDFRI